MCFARNPSTCLGGFRGMHVAWHSKNIIREVHIMSYTEWLYDELVNDGFIDESEYEADELTKSLILTSTEVDEDDLDNYAEQFKEHCDSRGETPDWDLED